MFYLYTPLILRIYNCSYNVYIIITEMQFNETKCYIGKFTHNKTHLKQIVIYFHSKLLK